VIFQKALRAKLIFLGKPVGLSRSGQGRADQLTEPRHERVAHAVKNTLPIAAALEHARPDEEREMLGNVGLSGLGEVHDVGDGARAVTNGLKDAEPGGLTERLEDGGDPFELDRGERNLGLTHNRMII